MSTSLDESSEQEVLRALLSVLTANYGIMASCALLVYDFVLTLGREINFIWRSKWTFPKMAYLWARYYGMAYVVTMTTFSLKQNSIKTSSCRHYYAWMTYGGPIIFTTLSNVIFMLRVYALYNQCRSLLIFFVILQAGQLATDLVVTVRANSMIVDLSAPSSYPWPGCLASGYDARGTLIAWIPNVLIALILCVMTLWSFIKEARECRHGNMRATPLLITFVRDGTLHFFMLVVALVIVLILVVVVESPAKLLCSSWMITIYSLSTSRLILHIRVFTAHQQGSAVTRQENLFDQDTLNIS